MTSAVFASNALGSAGIRHQHASAGKSFSGVRIASPAPAPSRAGRRAYLGVSAKKRGIADVETLKVKKSTVRRGGFGQAGKVVESSEPEDLDLALEDSEMYDLLARKAGGDSWLSLGAVALAPGGDPAAAIQERSEKISAELPKVLIQLATVKAEEREVGYRKGEEGDVTVVDLSQAAGTKQKATVVLKEGVRSGGGFANFLSHLPNAKAEAEPEKVDNGRRKK